MTTPQRDQGIEETARARFGHRASGAESAAQPAAESPLPPNEQAASAYGPVRGLDPSEPDLSAEVSDSNE